MYDVFIFNLIHFTKASSLGYVNNNVHKSVVMNLYVNHYYLKKLAVFVIFLYVMMFLGYRDTHISLSIRSVASFTFIGIQA